VYVNGTLTKQSNNWKCVKASGQDSGVFTLGKANMPLDSSNSDKFFTSASFDEIVTWKEALHPAVARLIYFKSMGIKLLPEESQKIEDKTNLVNKRRNEIMWLLYVEFGINIILFIFVLGYFPDKPSIPPSISAHHERDDFFEGTKQLIRSPSFWTLCMVYGVTTGVYSGWGAVLNVNLSGFGVSQDEAGWLGFYAVLAGIGAGMILARCADLFTGYMKVLLLILFTGATGCFLWFCLICLRLIAYSKDSLYKSAILGGFFVSGSIPLFYELTIEQTYPIAEGITTGVLTLVNNLWTVLFLLILVFPNAGTIWMNWALFGACAITIPVLIMFRVQYRRLDVDLDVDGVQVGMYKGDSDTIPDRKSKESNKVIKNKNFLSVCPDDARYGNKGSLLSLPDGKFKDVFKNLDKKNESKL